jgi:hypothetical protein
VSIVPHYRVPLSRRGRWPDPGRRGRAWWRSSCSPSASAEGIDAGARAGAELRAGAHRNLPSGVCLVSPRDRCRSPRRGGSACWCASSSSGSAGGIHPGAVPGADLRAGAHRRLLVVDRGSSADAGCVAREAAARSPSPGSTPLRMRKCGLCDGPHATDARATGCVTSRRVPGSAERVDDGAAARPHGGGGAHVDLLSGVDGDADHATGEPSGSTVHPLPARIEVVERMANLPSK